MTDASTESRGVRFWADYQPGFTWATEERGTPEFFAEVERTRYSIEPHIPDVVDFPSWRDSDVLEVGCGIATDGARFARAGARYVGADRSETAIELAGERFALEGLEGSFTQTPAGGLPFDDASFDLVFSHGVVHHIRDPGPVIAEFERVLRPGGTALVMVYHRNSLNYYASIMGARRLAALTLLIPGADRGWSALLGEKRELLAGHRDLLREHGARYLTDTELFLSNNTDGPGNPYSRVYSRAEVERLLAPVGAAQTEVRHLNLRLFPGGARVSRSALGRRLERSLGWHLYARAVKEPQPATL